MFNPIRFRLVSLVALLAAGCGAPANVALLGGKTETPAQALDAAITPLMADPQTPNNQIALYPDRDAYPALKAMLEGATKSIFVETFEFHDDSKGEELSDLLIAKHNAGVDVHVIMDGIGDSHIHSQQATNLIEHGVPTAVYGPFPFWHSGGTKGVNFTHRKLYLVDGNSGMTGGMNLGDDYFDTIHDMLWRVDGAAANIMAKEFAAEWVRAKGTGTVTVPDLATASYGTEPIGIAVTSGLEKGREHEIHDVILDAIDHATRRIDMGYPFFWDDAVLQHLVQAQDRGVAVHVTLTTHDKPSMHRLNLWSARTDMPQGVDFHWYEKSFAHIKYCAIDSGFLLVGSSNADGLTYFDDQELDLVLTNPQTVAMFRQRVSDPDWASTPAVTQQDINIPWWDKPVYDLEEIIDNYM